MIVSPLRPRPGVCNPLLVWDWRESGFVRDLRAWPKEHQRIRIGFSLAGVVAFVIGTALAAGIGVPADIGAGRLKPGAVPVYIIVLLPLTAGPFAVYVRYITSWIGSVLTGVTLVGMIIYAFIFMVTSTSSTAGLAIFGPVIYNWAVVGGGVMLDRFVQWTRGR